MPTTSTDRRGPSPRVWGERCRAAVTNWQNTDHPHACGENGNNRSVTVAHHGPSPRVWGELCVLPVHAAVRRTIPTRVGRTPGSGSWRSLLPDHPHACGENELEFDCSSDHAGPSPRVWGEPPMYESHVRGRRTIPTRVGRTRAGSECTHAMSDHPHACGENILSAWANSSFAGPSPRVWGEQCFSVLGTVKLRTIPTRVGRTEAVTVVEMELSDHPHACGEN